MKRWLLVALMLGGCNAMSATPPQAVQSAVQTHPGLTFRLLYSFGGYGGDGVTPEAPLTNLDGTLYGTTIGGGSGCYSSGGCGTVFAITTSGAESVLHGFTGAKDGAVPYAGLTAYNGVLFGTTGGGASTSGTVFKITRSGTETVLYNFKGAPDGYDPRASLRPVGINLFGTTAFGGTAARGTIFKVSTSGSEKVVHSFTREHGELPESNLFDLNNVFYGTTYQGGPKQRGTIFAIKPTGEARILHMFQGDEQDGSYPRAGVINVNGTLYGTTSGGGVGGCEGCGNHEHYGTVFQITPGSKERVLYKFKGYPKDGAVPDGDLVYTNGVLYGTTESGGANCAVSHGCGTIFSLTLSGLERTIYSFSPANGAHPVAGLIDVNGTLYGTTPVGGRYDEGTVFSLSP